MILVWGSTNDAPVAAVLDALEAQGRPVVWLADAALTELAYDFSIGPDPQGWLEIAGQRLALAELSAVYLRPGASRPETVAASTALIAVLQTLPCRVVNRPAAGRSNHAKPFQLAQLAAAGLKTPETLVTSDLGAARAFLSQYRRIVYKSISGVRSTVAAIELRAESEKHLDRLGHGPVQLQRWIDGTDVRVHVIGQRWFATEIRSVATDYRYAGVHGQTAELTAYELPQHLGEQLVRLTHDMGLLVSGIDLRRTSEGDWYAFEVNPSPGFTYYEAHTGQPIAVAIADLLGSSVRDHDA